MAEKHVQSPAPQVCDVVKGKRKSRGVECCVFGCQTMQYGPDGCLSGISLFTFPQKGLRKTRWCNVIKRQDGRDGFKVTPYTKICQLHFKHEDIITSFAKRRKSLKKEAEPSLNLPLIDRREELFPRKRPCNRETPASQDMSETDTGEQSIEISYDGEEVSSGKQEEASNDKQDTMDTNRQITQLAEKVKFLERKVLSQEVIIEDQKNKLMTDTTSSSPPAYSYETICTTDDNVRFYTGLPTRKRFEALYEFLDFGDNGENLRQYTSEETTNVNNSTLCKDHCYVFSENSFTTKSKSTILNTKDQLFLTLCRIRQGFHQDHLALIFGISQSTVSRYFLSMINYMYLKLGSVNTWPTTEQVKARLPEAFKERFPTCRSIIDCSEIFCEVPQSLIDSSVLYSSYKSHVTLKFLLGIEPAGGVTFISQLYPGSTSDREIVLRSGYLSPDLWNSGDTILADRGFQIQDLFTPLGVNVNIPTFLGGRGQMDFKEVVYTQQIANLRIHIERAIQRVKTFHILDRVIPLSCFGSINQIITVICLLTNFQDPIISQ